MKIFINEMFWTHPYFFLCFSLTILRLIAQALRQTVYSIIPFLFVHGTLRSFYIGNQWKFITIISVTVENRAVNATLNLLIINNIVYLRIIIIT